MENFKYIKFKDPTYPNKIEFNWVQKVIIKILNIFIPKGNPDYEDAIDNVAEWKLEFNLKADEAWREIGYDNSGSILMRLPNDRNYGYWTDNNLKLEDYENFKPTEITKEDFIDDWQR